MNIFRLSSQAEEDFLQIGIFTIQRWGIDQADRYLAQLEACCSQFSDMPNLGRPANEIRPGLRRIERGPTSCFIASALMEFSL